MAPVWVLTFEKLWFRFRESKSYGSYDSGSGSTTLLYMRNIFLQADVQCPVCLASFPPEIIEGHAARCGEENGIYV
jgi:hypothetical protein